ncbi:MAG: SDR family oxidoreductase [Chthonomonadales bacterium]|nr:SDR family oxidoreductase [Chthonomonadales bacterium]
MAFRDPVGPCFADLAGRTAIVTGGGTNIGRGIALRLAAERARVVVCGRRAQPIEETCALVSAAGGECAALTADVSIDADLDRLFDLTVERYDTVDVMVHNAAAMLQTDARRVTDPQWDRAFATIARAAFVLARKSHALMAPRGHGALVYVSTVGALRAHHRGLPYDAAKAAADGLVRALALDYGTEGIRVNAVAPGPIPELRDDVAPRPLEAVPLGRAGTAAEVAAAVAFLASDQASYITGQILYVDGGLTTQLSPRSWPV